MSRRRTAIPPYEVRRDDHGFAIAVSRGSWDIIHLHSYGSQRTEENIEAVVKRLNAAPLDWPVRYDGRKQKVGA